MPEADSPLAPPSRRDWFALGAVTVVGAALRLYQLGAYSLWYDEGATLFLTQYVATPADLFDVTKTTEPPLNAVLAWLWLGFVALFSDAPAASSTSDFLLRLLPCLFSIASVPLVFLLTRTILRDSVSGLLAALLFAINPFQIYYAQDLRIYTFYVFLWLIAIYCLVAALDRGGWGWWCGLVVCEVLSVYSHFISIWTVFTINLFFLFTLWQYRHHFWKWVVSQALVVLLVAPILPTAFYMNNLLATKTVAWYPDPTLITGILTFKNFFAGYGATPWAYWGLFLLGGALCAVGILSCWRRWTAGLLLAVLIAVPVLGNLLMWSLRSFSFYEHRLFILSGVIALIAAAHGLRILRRRPLIALVAFLYLALTVPTLRDYYQGRIHPEVPHRIAVYDRVDLRSAAQYIDEHWQEGDLVAHASHFTVYSMAHYLDRPQIRLGRSEEDAAVMLQTFGTVQEELLREHNLMPAPVEEGIQGVNRIWWIQTFGNTFEHKPLTDPIRAWLDEHLERERVEEFSGVAVTLYGRE